MVEKQYYSISEVGKILGLTRQSVSKAIENGTIKAIKINGVYRIPKNQFDIIDKGE